MSQKPSFNKLFSSLVVEDISLATWLIEDNFNGIWIFEFGGSGNFWINDIFWESIDYDESLANDLEENWNCIIPDNIKHYVLSSLDKGFNVYKATTKKFNFKNSYKETVPFQVKSNKVKLSSSEEYLLLKFSKIQEQTKHHYKLKSKIAIYHETNELAKVGGWEVDLENNKVFWSEVTKDIHEVSQDHEPNIEGGINFYKPGWSRDKIIKLFTDAVENGVPFDAELKLVTAKNNEIWVRSLGKPEFKDGKCVRVYGAFQDIDIEKQTQLEYERTKEEYGMIFENSSIGNILVNATGELHQANPAALRIFGFEKVNREEVMKFSIKDIIHPDFLDHAISFRQRLLSGEIDNYQLESKFFKKDGSIIWCRTNSSIIRSKDYEENLIITQVEDITIKKDLEFRSNENAQRFKTAFEYSPIGMGLVGPDSKWEMVNQSLADIFGYTKEELISKKSSELIHDDDLRKDTRELKALLSGEIDSYSSEKRFIHKNGKTIYGLFNVSSIKDDEGVPIYLVGQISDLTKRILSERARRKSLKELENLMDATTQVSIIQTDLEGVVSKFNKGAENLLGYRAEDVKDILNICSLHDSEEIIVRGKELSEKYNQQISGFGVFSFQASRGHYDSREWSYIREDGSRFPVQLVVTSITNYKGKITGYLGVATDISDLKKMEHSLIKAKRKAEAANKAKSEFLANMSHEIRTPLNGIIGFTDLLMRTKMDETQGQYMKTVYNSANSLMDIINDILDFSKIEAGKLELSEEETDLVLLCDQTIDMIKHQAHSKGLEVLLNISPHLKRYVYADTIRLRQILINLMGNAVKFTQQGEIELSVDSKVLPDNNEEILFSFAIRDTGIGIAPKNLKKIFNAFDQEDASTTRKYGGSGLGLTISNKLLNLMNSKLEVKSTLNKGSVFSFKVKLKPEEQENNQTKPVFNINKVLIVDDNANNRIILREMLAVNKITSTECSNGIDALKLLKQGNENFDLAIIDYNMPYMDGIMLIEQIRNSMSLGPESLPIILLHSSIDDEKILKGCREFQVHSNITKPIHLDKLYEIIGEIEQPGEIFAKQITDVPEEPDFSKDFNILLVEDNPVNQFLANTIIKNALPNATILQAENGEEAIEQFQNNELDLIFMDIQMPILSGFEATEKIREIEKENSHIPIIALTARTVKD